MYASFFASSLFAYLVMWMIIFIVQYVCCILAVDIWRGNYVEKRKKELRFLPPVFDKNLLELMVEPPEQLNFYFWLAVGCGASSALLVSLSTLLKT